MSQTVSKLFICLLLGWGCTVPAWADDDEHGSWWTWGSREKHESRSLSGLGTDSPAPSAFQTECAACHIAYPAGLLPSGSWQHLMANLNQHFGSDASLDAATTQAIATYLTNNAGTYKRVSEMPPQDRITQSYWFARKHNKHVDASVWSRPAIGSRSNCAACHAGADQGNFNEHSVRIPG